MKTFSAGNIARVPIDLVTRDGEAIVPVSASFKVYDDTGVELGSEAIAVTGNECEIVVVVPGADNVIDAAALNGARTVVLTVVSADGQFDLSETYLLERPGFLAVPEMSAMTVQQSVMLSATMRQVVTEVWAHTDDHDRRAALMEAWSRISKFSFRPWRSTDDAAAAPDRLLNSQFRTNELSLADWQALPEHFKTALKRAQFIEACVILEGDPTWDRRVDGLISKTVGESSEMFSGKKPLISSISPKALRELKGYMRRSVRIAR